MRPHYRSLARIVMIGVTAFAIAGCATHSRKHNNTLIGAGLGAATGAVLTQGDPLYTLGGAAAGGVLGNILTEEKRSYRSRSDRGRSHAARGKGRNGWQHKNRGHRHPKHSRR